MLLKHQSFQNWWVFLHFKKEESRYWRLFINGKIVYTLLPADFCKTLTFQHGSIGSTLLLCQSCHAMPLIDGDGQMVHLITCQVHFRNACSSSKCFQGRLPRWFFVTNHLTRQVKLSLESLITSCIYHWPHSTKDISIMIVEMFPKLLFTLLNCSRKSPNSLSITNTFQDAGLCCTLQSLHWQWMNEARMLQIQHKMEPLGRIQVSQLLGSGLCLDFK